jgi:opacity protein-like surface antigen
MKARLYAIVFAALSMASVSTAVLADNDSNNVSWKRVIGIIQAGNMVGNIQGGGQPWSTLGGEARVNLRTGHVEFEVRGLVLAGGNSIGTPDGITQVKGTIVCNPGPTQFVVDTPLVPLSAQGDAEFEGNLSPFPTVCTPTNLAFLVRIAADRWIANGAVRSSP